MAENTLVIGGCRSGKSRHALTLAEEISKKNRAFIATCIPLDDEMRYRVSMHQKERSVSWKTVEAPVDVPEAIASNSPVSDVILVDCITLWVSNLLMESEDFETVSHRVEQLTKVLKKAECPVILVSNEVGTGIVPENRLARKYRDMAGFANQRLAAHIDRVIWMVAGIPVQIKG
mgnify:CR=1 FL=1